MSQPRLLTGAPTPIPRRRRRPSVFAGALTGLLLRRKRRPARDSPGDRPSASGALAPIWVALGTVALELLAAVGISNLLRKRLGHARWRRVHYLTFVVWAAATAHGMGAGTDTGAGWLRLLYIVSVGSVTAAVAWRLGSRRLVPTRG
jgi:hypothetical protein